MLAWELGVKALTFYPDGSRLSQPVEQIAKKVLEQESDLLNLLSTPIRRLKIEHTFGQTYKIKVGTPTGSSTLHVSLNSEIDRPGQLVEVYARMGKPGAIESGLLEAIGRLSSSFLQYAAQFGEAEREQAERTITNQLINIQSGYAHPFTFPGEEKGTFIQSPCDGLAKAIISYKRQNLSVFVSETSSVEPDNTTVQGKMTCCACGSSDISKGSGCWVCGTCGYSRCG